MPLDPVWFEDYDKRIGLPHQPGQVIYISKGKHTGHTATVMFLWFTGDDYVLAAKLDDGRDVSLFPDMGDWWGTTRPDGAVVGPIEDYSFPQRRWRP